MPVTEPAPLLTDTLDHFARVLTRWQYAAFIDSLNLPPNENERAPDAPEDPPNHGETT